MSIPAALFNFSSACHGFDLFDARARLGCVFDHPPGKCAGGTNRLEWASLPGRAPVRRNHTFSSMPHENPSTPTIKFLRCRLPPRHIRANARTVARLILLALAFLCVPAHAQKDAAKTRAAKLPAPERIVNDYLKAVGGKKRVQSIRDATYEWTAEGNPDERARTFVKAPASARSDFTFGGGESNGAVSARTAWRRTPDGVLSTLTGAEANSAKLEAALAANGLVDYKKQDVLARTAGVESVGGETAYVVEFSRRNGARVRYWFGATTKLLLKTSADTPGGSHLLSDYRAAAGGVLVAHRAQLSGADGAQVTHILQDVRFNTGLADTLFEPAGDSTLNVVELLREVSGNQRAVDERVSEYTYTRAETEREISDKGELKKEKTVVHEIYPIAGGGRVLKLVSENGVPLTAEKAEREERRVAERIEKLERENNERKQKKERAEAARPRNETGAGADGDDDALGISVFLRASEFVSPRRERFRDRDAVVFDFRPRPGFKASNRGESIVSKLTGVVWIDPVDKQVMRLEGRLTEGFKIGGGLLASVRPGSAFVFEQTRLADGVWLPGFSQINAAAKLFLFAGMRIDATREYSNYKRFSSKTGDATVDAPKPPPEN